MRASHARQSHGTRPRLGRLAIGSLLVFGLAAVVTVAAIAAPAATTASRTGAANQIEGSWIVTVTRVNPPANVAPTFKSLMTFDSGGGMTETSSTGTTLRGPAHGAWERIGGRLYATTMVLFRFNPTTGAFLGTQKVNRTMRLSQDGQTFEAVSLAAQYDPAGNLIVGGLRATEAGDGIQVERIADQP